MLLQHGHLSDSIKIYFDSLKQEQSLRSLRYNCRVYGIY